MNKPMKLLNWVKKVSILRYVYYLSIDLYTHSWDWIKIYFAEKRVFNTFNKIRGLKNMHSGERCFITRNGPSLTVYDLEMLDRVISFASSKMYIFAN